MSTDTSTPTRRTALMVGIAAGVVAVLLVAAFVGGVFSDDDPDAADDDAAVETPDDTDAGDGDGPADDDGSDDVETPGADVSDPDEPDADVDTDGAPVDGTIEVSGVLRDATPEDLRIGTAVAGGGHHEAQPYPAPFPNDGAYVDFIAEQFDSVTPENQLKWEFVHPQQGEYDFGPADEIVDFAEEHDLDVRGHALLWHSQNPTWLENGDFTPDELRDILRDHIETVAGHYRGRIAQWDVANEVFDDNAELRMEENIWLRELGVEVIADAFRWAHEADPDALLFINDYNVEGMNAKSTAYYDLIEDLLADDVPIHGFGIQGHLSIEYGFPGNVQGNLERFDALGIETAFTEVDIRMALGDDGPTEQQLERQANDYVELLDACLNVAGCRSFTLWGFLDGYSWVPHFFSGEGAASVIGEDLQGRPSFDRLLERLEAGR